MVWRTQHTMNTLKENLLDHGAKIEKGNRALGTDADDICAVDEGAVEGYLAEARLARDGSS